MNVLSLFDGLSGGRVALDYAGIHVDNYYASEIDKPAIKVSEANYPDIIRMGNVVNWREWDIDWASIDLFIGGSPCQGFSSSGKQGGTKAVLEGETYIVDSREMYLEMKEKGAEFLSQSFLFWEYVLCLDHVKAHNPNVKFLLENVKMTKPNMKLITDAMGVEPILINSALVSAQNRLRWYWTNWEVKQPEDKGIHLHDIIEYGVDETPYLVTEKHQNRLETSTDVPKKFSVIDPDKAITMTARQFANWKGNYLSVGQVRPAAIVGRRINPKTGTRDDYNPEAPRTQCLEVHEGAKTRCLSTVSKDTLISSEEPGRYTDAYKRTDIKYRKLTPVECERLQTLPDGYTAAASNSQRYRMLGNGWTIAVIAHLFSTMN